MARNFICELVFFSLAASSRSFHICFTSFYDRTRVFWRVARSSSSSPVGIPSCNVWFSNFLGHPSVNFEAGVPLRGEAWTLQHGNFFESTFWFFTRPSKPAWSLCWNLGPSDYLQLESSRGKHYQQRQRNLHDLRCPSMSQLLRTSKSYLKIEAKSDNLINMINSTDQFEPLAAWYIWFCVQAFLHSSATRGIPWPFMAFLSFRRCQWHSFWSAGVANKAGATTGGAGIVAWCFQKQGHATREWATFHVWKPAGKGGVARRLPLDKLVDEGMVRSFISHVTSSEMHLQIIVHRPLLPEFVLVELGREVIQSTNTVSRFPHTLSDGPFSCCGSGNLLSIFVYVRSILWTKALHCKTWWLRRDVRDMFFGRQKLCSQPPLKWCICRKDVDVGILWKGNTDLIWFDLVVEVVSMFLWEIVVMVAKQQLWFTSQTHSRVDAREWSRACGWILTSHYLPFFLHGSSYRLAKNPVATVLPNFTF